MTAPDPIVSLPDYQAFAAGTDVDVRRLDGVIAAVRSYCGWHVAPAYVETFVVDGPGGTVLALPTLRLNDVTSITENDVVLTVADIEWSRDGTLRKGRWTTRYRGVTVVASHGYATVPADLVAVVLDAVSRAVSVPAGQVAEKFGPFEYGGSQGGVQFFEHELAVLDRYRLEPQP